MKTLYIIIIILILIFGAVASIVYLNKDTWDLNRCIEECEYRGYETGDCLWSTEAETNNINIGPCFIAQSRHCGNKDQCNCYCANELIACTADAKQCPDGSYVSRISPNCEFAECPNEQIIGGETDEHECMLMAGYTWNQTKQECVKEWEETLKDACINLGCSSNTLFVGSKNSDKYYECKCGWAKTINPENIVCFENDEQALSDNRVKSEC